MPLDGSGGCIVIETCRLNVRWHCRIAGWNRENPLVIPRPPPPPRRRRLGGKFARAAVVFARHADRRRCFSADRHTRLSVDCPHLVPTPVRRHVHCSSCPCLAAHTRVTNDNRKTDARFNGFPGTHCSAVILIYIYRAVRCNRIDNKNKNINNNNNNSGNDVVVRHVAQFVWSRTSLERVRETVVSVQKKTVPVKKE